MTNIKKIRYYTAEDVCQLLNISLKSCYTYIKKGWLKADKIGGNKNGWKIYPTAIREFCETKKNSNTWLLIRKQVIEDIRYNQAIQEDINEFNQ